MQGWEYLTVHYARGVVYVNSKVLTPKQDLHEYLNWLGGQAWELVGFSSDQGTDTYVFKRPKR